MASKKTKKPISVTTETATDGTVTTNKTYNVKVTEHPRSYLYPGKQCSEHLNATMEWMAKSKGVLPTLDEVKKFTSKIKHDDIVGIEYNAYRVIGVGEDGSIAGSNMRTKEEKILPFDDVAFAVATGFAEILYRDNKPFGVKQTQKVNIKIVDKSAVKQDSTEETK